MLVVCTARILVYNCLEAPYLPPGGLPDRYVRYPNGPIGRSFPLKNLRTLKFFKRNGPPPCRCVQTAGRQKSQSGPDWAARLAEGMVYRSTAVGYCRLRSPLTVYQHGEARKSRNSRKPGNRGKPTGFSENEERRRSSHSCGVYGSDPCLQLPGRAIPASRWLAGPLREVSDRTH